MGEPFVKTSACLRVAASAKAGADLKCNEHLRLRPLLRFTLGEAHSFP
jgi:hypothetical protein